MPDKIDELVERVRRIEQQLATLVRQLPDAQPAADQTLAEGSIDLTGSPAHPTASRTTT